MEGGQIDEIMEKAVTFKDILINATNDDVTIPISATFDKAVLHIGIGNRTGVSIEKPEMKEGRKLKTSVEYATKEFMGRHFDVEKREASKRKERRQESKRKRKNTHESVIVKSTEKNASKEVFNFKVDSKGDTEVLENSCKKELSNDMYCADIIYPERVSAPPIFTNTPEFAREKLLKKDNFVLSVPGDLNDYTKHIMELSKKLSEAAMQGAVSEIEPLCTTKPWGGGQMYITKLSNAANKYEEIARKLSIVALHEAVSEMEPLCNTKPLDRGQMYITKLSNATNKREEIARALSEEALQGAVSDIEPLCTTKLLGGGQMYITKLSNTANKREEIARKLSEVALRNAVLEMLPPWSTKPLGARRMYITKLSTNKHTEVAKNLPDAAVCDAFLEMVPALSAMPQGTMQLPCFKEEVLKTHDQYRSQDGTGYTNDLLDIGKELSETAIRDAISEIASKVTTKPSDQVVFADDKRCTDLLMKMSKDLTETALRDAILEMMPLYNTKPPDTAQMYITKLLDTVQRLSSTGGARESEDYKKMEEVINVKRRRITMDIMDNQDLENIVPTSDQDEKEIKIADTAVKERIESELPKDLFTGPGQLMNVTHIGDKIIRSSEATPQTELEIARDSTLVKVPCVSEELSNGKPDLKTSGAVANVSEALVDKSAKKSDTTEAQGRMVTAGKVITAYEPANQHVAVHIDTTLTDNVTRSSEIAHPDCTLQDPNIDETHSIENSSNSSVPDSPEESISSHTITTPENLVPTTVSLSDIVAGLTDGMDGNDHDDDAFGIMSIFLNSDIHCDMDKNLNSMATENKDFGYMYFSLSNFIKF